MQRKLLLTVALGLGLVAGVPSSVVYAQPAPSSENKLLLRGQSLFDDQQYEESIQTLSAALLRPSNTKEQKIAIYRLLALNYITINRKEEAESAVRGLLALEPEYALPAKESPRFRNFFAEVQKKWEAEGRPGLVTVDKAPPPAVVLRHSVPSEAKHDQSIEVRARIEDPGKRVASVKLFVRAGSKGKFEERPMNGTGLVSATIPGTLVKPPLLEYYLEAFDEGGLPVATRGDAEDPLRIVVPEPSKGWVLPVAIGGGVLGAAAIVGILALAGVFKSSSSTPPPPGGGGRSTVTIIVGE